MNKVPDGSASRLGALVRPLAERRNFVPAAIFLFFTVMLICLKLIRQDQQYGDSALYFQMTDNIASRGLPVTSVFTAIRDFSIEHRLAASTAQEIAADPLLPVEPPDYDSFRFHAHVILYPIAVLAKFVSARVALLSLFVLSFTGLILAVYLILRDRSMPVAAVTLFCLLIISHPAWSQAFQWQFYPERLFVLAGFLFMYLATRDGTKRGALIALGVVCAMIIERTAIMAGVFLIMYTLLYWKRNVHDQPFRLGLGAVLLLYGLIILKFVLVNQEYSTFLPANLAELLAHFSYPGFESHLGIFLLVNAFLMVLALFEWRAAAIAIVFMLPNIFGNIGGAEKIGWATHYQDIYLPALVWAAMLGFSNAYRLARTRHLVPVFYGATCALILLLNYVGPAATMADIGVANLGNNFFAGFVSEANTYFGPDGRALDSAFSDLGSAVPEGSVVSVPEDVMTELYPGRTIRAFPVDIDHAGYAVLSYSPSAAGGIDYRLATSYLGPAETAKIDQVLLARMRRDGYDFKRPILIPRLGVAVLRRANAGNGS